MADSDKEQLNTKFNGDVSKFMESPEILNQIGVRLKDIYWMSSENDPYVHMDEPILDIN